MIKFIPLLLILLFSCQKEELPPVPVTKNAKILKVSRYLNTFKGKYIENKKILIDQGSIILIADEIKTERPVPMIDLTGYTVLPGLIDTHTLIFLEDQSYGTNLGGELKRVAKENEKKRWEKAVSRAQQLLKAGFTSIRDLGNSGQFLDVKLRNKILKRELTGPRMFVSGPGIAINRGQFAKDSSSQLASGEYTLIDDKTDFDKMLSIYIANEVDVLKLYADNEPNEEIMPAKLLEQVVGYIHGAGLKVALHASYKEAIANGVKARVETIQHGTEVDDETLKKMGEKRVYLVPTELSNETYSWIQEKNGHKDIDKRLKWYISRRSDRIKKALDYNVPIAFGSDMYLDLTSMGITYGEAPKLTLYSYVDSGMTPAQAIRSATYNAAFVLGQQGRLGEIEHQGMADIIALKGDPLKNIKDLDKVEFVMISGEVVRDDKGVTNIQ